MTISRISVLALIAVGFGVFGGVLLEGFIPATEHDWKRHNVADQQALAIVAGIGALVYLSRWVGWVHADARDRYYTQIGAVVLLVSLAVDKQFWTEMSLIFLAGDREAHAQVRSMLYWLPSATTMGAMLGLAIMTTPWWDRLIRVWWAPWVLIPALWCAAYYLRAS